MHLFVVNSLAADWIARAGARSCECKSSRLAPPTTGFPLVVYPPDGGAIMLKTSPSLSFVSILVRL